MELDVRIHVKMSPKVKNLLNEQALQLLKKFHRETKYQPALEIHYCGDGRMRTLKRNFLGIDQTTDVLSFPSLDPGLWKNFSNHLLLGELFINVPMSGRLAKRLQLKQADVLSAYLVHGFTHLVGYDHEVNPRSFLEREKKYLKFLKVPVSITDLQGYSQSHG